MNPIDVDSILNQVAIDAVQRLISSETSYGSLSDDRIMFTSHREEQQQLLEDAYPPAAGREIHNHEQGSLLSSDFQPSEHCVIVGRGREAKNNPGNKRLRTIAATYLDQYSHATNDKNTKSRIVSHIVSMVDDACNGEGFIKRDSSDRWYKVDNAIAREKVGCLLRDMLAHKYRSSSKAKVALRQKKRCSSTSAGDQWNNVVLSPLRPSLFDIMPSISADVLLSGQDRRRDEEEDNGFSASDICYYR